MKSEKGLSVYNLISKEGLKSISLSPLDTDVCMTLSLLAGVEYGYTKHRAAGGTITV